VERAFRDFLFACGFHDFLTFFTREVLQATSNSDFLRFFESVYELDEIRRRKAPRLEESGTKNVEKSTKKGVSDEMSRAYFVLIRLFS